MCSDNQPGEPGTLRSWADEVSMVTDKCFQNAQSPGYPGNPLQGYCLWSQASRASCFLLRSV